MANARRMIGAAVLAAALGASPQVDAGVQDPISFDMHCAQIAGSFRVDYAVARSLVPAEYEAVQATPGYALLAMPIQDCISLEVNGEEVGPAPVVHFWIQVAGPQDSVEILPGVLAERDYYYSIAEHTSTIWRRMPVIQIGYEGKPIESLTLGDVIPTGNGYAVRDGGVVEKVLGNAGEYGYRWHTMLVSFPTVVVPVAHAYYHTKNDGKRGETDVRCIVWLNGIGPAQLTVDPRSDVAALGAALAGEAKRLTMKCNAYMWQIK